MPRPPVAGSFSVLFEDTSALLKGEWRAASLNEDPELAGLWRVSVGLQDGAQAYGYTMWLTVHFAVESRSGAVNGVLLEGPELAAESGEGPKARTRSEPSMDL